jgi:hypothetical protein
MNKKLWKIIFLFDNFRKMTFGTHFKRSRAVDDAMAWPWDGTARRNGSLPIHD